MSGLAVGAAVPLGACAYLEPSPSPVPVPASMPAASTDGPKLEGTKVVASLPKPPAAKPPPPRPTLTRLDPNSLVGLDEQEVAGVLGNPKGAREQPPARIWLYSADGCEAELFFYLDLASRKFHVLTYDVKLAETARRDDAINLCLGRIRTANRGREP